jgi:hypothetical protein
VGFLSALLVSLVFVGTATAKIVELYVYDGPYPTGSFDASDSVGGVAPFGSSLRDMDINQATGDIYVGYQAGGGLIYRFNEAGVSQPFSALSPNTVIPETPTDTLGATTVDNSGTGTQGRIYQWPEFGDVKGFLPTGAPIGPPFPLPGGPLGDHCGGDVGPNGDIWITRWSPGIDGYTSGGVSTGKHIPADGTCAFAIDAAENFYTVQWSSGLVRKFDSAGQLVATIDDDPGEPGNIAVDRSTGHVFIGYSTYVKEYDSAGGLIGEFGRPEGAYPGLLGVEGLAVNQTTQDVYVTNNRLTEGVRRVDKFTQTGPITIPDVTTNLPSVTPTTALLKGHVDPDIANGGTEITSCRFEWGTTTNYGNSVNCDQALPINGPMDVTAELAGLNTGQTYHFRITAANLNEVQSNGGNVSFEPAGPPEITNEAVSEVNTDGARISATINPGGGSTTYRVEYGTTEAYGNVIPIPDGELEDNLISENISHALSGLSPGTTYHFRVVATNLNGTTNGPDHAFTTFPSDPAGVDSCPNAQVRQQTGAAKLLDCRAYELASAASTGGYDVQSTLIPGLETLRPQPRANDRVLYSVHFGKIPGTGEPTNYGLDPYVATRGAGGWETDYVGIPASGTPSTVPFGSPLAGSNTSLTAFAFGEGDLCDPCFPDGSTGIPVRTPDGSLVQGMRGSLNPGPGAEPAGEVRKALSADGSHLVFGSTSKFEPAGNNGSLTIYDRNLNAATTQVVSTLPNGTTMTGTVAGLDISADGSRALIGREVSTDEAGNTYYDLFMHVGASPNSIQVADTASGVIFNGMTSDGSKVFFTTPDAVAGTGDSDTSADLFRADVGTSSSTTALVSTGNSDACDPVPGKEGADWNAVSGGPDCGVVGLAGGAGVASGDGTVFFLSPEELDGSGELNEANLFAARPAEAPEHVATIEPIAEMVTNATFNSEVHRFSDFQVTLSGDHAVFSSSLALAGVNTFGHLQVYLYDTDGDSLVCASCATTGAAPISDATLASGLNLADDGTVFFTSAEALVLRDTNNKRDVYEWKDGEQQLVSTGISEFDAGLLSASADGVNVFFFTRATLVPQDKNGSLMKIYNARSGGGFLVIPSLPLCAAKDECHGPGTVPAPPPQIGTFKGQGGQADQDCGALARKAEKQSRQARKLRRRAANASDSASRKRLNQRADGKARASKRNRNRAKQCRQRRAGGGA